MAWGKESGEKGEIYVPVDTLREYMRKLLDFADDSDGIFDRISNMVLSMSSNGEWQGTDVEALIDATNRNRTKYQEAVEDVRRLAEFLDSYTAELEVTDLDLKSRIERI